MDIRIIKENQISIADVPNATNIISLPNGTVHIIGSRTCETCGHIEEVGYRTDTTDTIMVLPTNHRL